MLNYAEEAIAHLRSFISRLEERGSPVNPVLAMALLGLTTGVRFELPDSGRVLDGYDHKPGTPHVPEFLFDMPLRLPYPTTVLQYHYDDGTVVDPTSEVAVTERVLVLTESEGEILMTAVFRCDRGQGLMWVAYPAVACIKGFGPQGCLVAFHPAVDDGVDRTSNFQNDLSPETLVVGQFIAALSCSNVGIEDAASWELTKHNNRRQKKGLPKYEYKVLAITSKHVPSGGGSDTGGSHASPRQHLRRGHIRRWPVKDGGVKNIWVNACIVGDPATGVIKKDYLVKGR